MPRSRLGPLAVESKLGDDPASSSVWRAIHVQQKRSVAVKIFAAPFGGTPEARTAFSQEWEQLKAIQHPAIARCFGGGFEGTDAYLAYELIDGETLEAQLQRMTRVSWESVLDMAEPLADALAYLHSKGIVHGTIGLDKIMFAGLSPVLLNVRIDRQQSPYKSNKPIGQMETKLQAPELVKDRSAHNIQTDLYAFGAVLYWAITGEPPVSGSSPEEIRGNVEFQVPTSPASVVLDCPVWLDKLVVQLLEKNPAKRPVDATAVKLSLAEVRRRAMSRTGVAEHVSSGFSALQMTDQKDRDEARALLGREVVDLEKSKRSEVEDDTDWHERPVVLIGGLALMMAILLWVVWPASENTLRAEAEALIKQDTRMALSEAKLNPLREMLTRFPEGEHADWARDQVQQVDVRLFLHQLSVKIKNNLPIKDQGELLHKRAQDFTKVGDTSKALDLYHSIVTVLGDDPDYNTAVNAARAQIAALQDADIEDTEASRIVLRQLEQADRFIRDGRVVEAKELWYSLIKLYGDNSSLRPLIERAQDRLQEYRD